MGWEIIDSGALDATINMSIDQDLIAHASEINRPQIRFYDWTCPSATYGHFIQPKHFFHTDIIDGALFQISKRPTGGGIIFHESDFAFTIFLPATHLGYTLNTLQNYAYINEAVSRAVSKLTPTDLLTKQNLSSPHKDFCMAHPTIYDLMIGSKKVGGAAQRRTKNGLIHQCSIALTSPNIDYFRKYLIHPDKILKAIDLQSTSLLKKLSNRELFKKNLKTSIVEELENKELLLPSTLINAD